MSSAPQPFRLVLASASPRRRELLAQAGYMFSIEHANLDESQHAGESPSDYVRRLAEEKAQAVLAKQADQNNLIVLGADTTVVLDGEILGKPIDAADAKRMLRALSCRTHQVLTAIAAVTRAGINSAVEATDVTFAEIPDAELDLYCSIAEPLDKAGAYGIQGYAARWIPHIDGCYFNVMGLPISRTVTLLNAAAARLRG